MDQILKALNSCKLQLKPILQQHRIVVFGHHIHSAEHSNFLYYDTLQCSACKKLQEYISSLKAIPFRESSTHTKTHILKFPSQLHPISTKPLILTLTYILVSPQP